MAHDAESASTARPRSAALARCAAVAIAAACTALSNAEAGPLQSSWEPMGRQALEIGRLGAVTLALCTVVLVAILVALAWALRRAPRAGSDTPADASPPPEREARSRRSVIAAVAGSVFGLLFLIVASVVTDHALATLSLKDAVNITVTANQ